jgi:S-formylglutathione hydrolase FrmB
MKKVFLLITIGLILSFNLSALNRFIEKSFFSSALNQDKTYFVSYPDGYNQADTTQKYPVILFLHGASVDGQFTANQIDSVMSNPLAKFLFPNFYKIIFVIADGSAPPFLGSFYTNSELYGNFETYIAVDLYQEIRKKNNTYNYREKWTIMGHSMGGYGSMKIALKYPEKFIGIASLSGPLHTTYYNEILPLLLEEHGNTPPYEFNWQGDVTKLIYSMAGAFSPDTSIYPPVIFPVLSDGTLNQEVMPLWEAQNPINFIRTWKGDPNLAIFMYCGELDEYKLLPQNQLFSDSLTAYNIQHTFRIDPYGDHVNSLITSFPMGLNFLFDVMDTSKVETNHNSITRIEKNKNNLFPNPATDRIYLSTSANEIISNASICTIRGTLLQRFSDTDSKSGIPISSIEPGYYLLLIEFSNGKREIHHFIKAN